MLKCLSRTHKCERSSPLPYTVHIWRAECLLKRGREALCSQGFLTTHTSHTTHTNTTHIRRQHIVDWLAHIAHSWRPPTLTLQSLKTLSKQQSISKAQGAAATPPMRGSDSDSCFSVGQLPATEEQFKAWSHEVALLLHYSNVLESCLAVELNSLWTFPLTLEAHR